MNIADTGSAIWIERYESLRRHFLEGRQILGADPLGFALFLRLGAAGWMRHWATMPVASRKPVSPTQPLEPPPALTAEWQHQLTVVLAQMTARHLSTSLNL